MTLFKKILIANRGEIACRIIKTCQRLGIKSVAVGSIADRTALHMHKADEALVIGPAEAKDSYLNIQAILTAALETGAEAIHPGYGFLSENAEFAEAVTAAGLVFIGPSAKAIRTMGSKSEAKNLALRLDIPTIPGYHGEGQKLETLQKEALDIGYPVLIKATNGGGGKGMRRVDKEADFHEALISCQREAKAAFGSSAVLLEKYLPSPRHIEVQIMGDKQGNCIALAERDCSLQRRHQKVIEEAPASDLSSEVRLNLAESAVILAKSVHYEGAGTVEFLVDKRGHFYFLEMNTRLQVEHPVTEMVTELDLVEWQIRIAAGHPFPCDQKDIRLHGHAVEARLYAEDPETNFLPSTGRLTELSFPKESETVRVDSGVRKGDHITIHYDPMIAKICAWGKNRSAALQNLSTALAETKVQGVKTNLHFLQTLVNHEKVHAHPQDVGFLDRSLSEMTSVLHIPDEAFILAALWLSETTRQGDEGSPWFMGDGWRLNATTDHAFRFEDSEGTKEVRILSHHERTLAYCNDKEYIIESSRLTGSHIWALMKGKTCQATVSKTDSQVDILMAGHPYRLYFRKQEHSKTAPKAESHLNAPMPGRIISILAKPGQILHKDDPILVLEAMKMEHTIRSPLAGEIEKIHYSVGDFVEEGAELATVIAQKE